MKNNVVGWFEIYVDDMSRARKFYESVFQCKLEKLENPEIEMWSFNRDMTSYGASGALVRMPGFPAGQNNVLVYFSCEDCKVEEGRLIENGGRIQRAKSSIGKFGFISLAYDTEGNMFGLHSLS